MLLIKNGHIKTMAGSEMENGSVLIGDDGKIIAVGEEIFIHPESHWLMMEVDDDLQVLADEYVLDFHWEEQGDTVYYTALEEGECVLLEQCILLGSSKTLSQNLLL